MSAGLVRTTTYFDENLLMYAKRLAVDEQKSLYEVLNERLKEALGLASVGAKVVDATKKLSYEDLFGPPLNAHLKKKKLTRADYYEE